MKILKKLFIFILLVASITFVTELDKVSAETKAATVESEQAIPEGYTPIYDIADLYAIRTNPSGKYILMNDIDMTEATKEGGDWDQGNGWKAIENFSGTFDGNGYRIIGMQIFGEISGSSKYVGLFGITTSAVVRNLGVKDCNIDITDNCSTCCYVGGIIGYAKAGTTIQNCYVSGNMKIQENSKNIQKCCIGGIIGEACSYYDGDKYVTIENCFNMCDIDCSKASVGEYVGGILGYAWSFYGHLWGKRAVVVKNSYNVGVIKGNELCVLTDGTPIVGAFTGYHLEKYGTGISCYLNCNYLKESAQQGIGNCNDSTMIGYLSEGQMKTKECFVGYDFTDTWEIDPYCSYSYPQLKDNRVVRISSVKLKTKPSKLAYYQGDKLDLSDATIDITYEDEITTSIPVTTDMVSGYDMNKIGTQTVIVTYCNKKATFNIEVKEIPVTSITIPEMLSIERSKTYQMVADILPKNASNKSVKWETDDAKVVTVDDTGKVSAKNKGTATITATASNGMMAKCKVTVLVPATSVSLSKTIVSLKKGESIELTASIVPLESTDDIEWSSSNENVVEYNNGRIVAKNAGAAVIKAITTSGVTAECKVKVLVPATSVTLNKTSVELKKGEKEELLASVLPLDSTDDIQWSSSDENVVQYMDGRIIANNKGTATITATATSGVTAECKVTVLVPATSVKLSKVSIEIEKGDSAELTASMLPLDSTDDIEWSSSDENVAEYVDGSIIAHNKGTATITATATSGVTAECKVTVLVPATSVSLSKTSVELKKGDSAELTASMFPLDSTDDIEWSSSDENVAEYVDGSIIAYNKGTATITATATSGVTAECEVTVLVPATSVTVSLTLVTLKEGESVKLTASMLPLDSTNDIVWSSSNENVAEYKNGRIVAKKIGTATITATATSGVTAECMVIVSEPTVVTPPNTVTSENNTTPDNTSAALPNGNNESPATACVSKGTKITILDGRCEVKVISDDTKNPTVAYIKSTAPKAKFLKVPDTVKYNNITYKVTSIADKSFSGNKSVQVVMIGKNVTSIGKESFRGCKKLTKITLNSTKLTKNSIGKNALKGTNKKLTIKVPKNKVKDYQKYFKNKGNTKVKVKK